jgi:hypothetical protein
VVENYNLLEYAAASRTLEDKGIMTGLRAGLLRKRGSIPDRVNGFTSLPRFPAVLWYSNILIFNESRRLFSQM